MIKCINQINGWMSQNFLQLNKDKTEIAVFGAMEERLKTCAQLRSVTLTTSNQARYLGVDVDSDLSLNSHIKIVLKSAYYHLRNISMIRRLMSQQDLENLVHAFIFSKLDYCAHMSPLKVNQAATVNSEYCCLSPHTDTKLKKRSFKLSS